MKKKGSIILAGGLTLGIGAAAIFANSLLVSRVMATGIDNGSQAVVTAAGQDAATQSIPAERNETTKSTPAEQDAAPAVMKTLENGETVIVRYHDDGNGIKASVTYESADGRQSVYDYEGDVAEAVIERYGGPKRDLPVRYVESEPGVSDLREETAVSAAIEKLTQKYALKQTLLDEFTVITQFYSLYEDLSVPVWWVCLYPANPDAFSEIGCYTAILDAATGEALRLLSAADGKG
ncbi:MAG: hypothetical protein LBQ15_00455 [Clostridium sp.]|jgi:hypothetical protein|nr:hypothetical protein [Clostridium sp.]